MLAYALYRRDPVFIIGQATGAFIYSRNLWLIAAERAREIIDDRQNLAHHVDRGR